MLSCFHLIPEHYGQMDITAISISCVSVLTHDKNVNSYFNLYNSVCTCVCHASGTKQYWLCPPGQRHTVHWVPRACSVAQWPTFCWTVCIACSAMTKVVKSWHACAYCGGPGWRLDMTNISTAITSRVWCLHNCLLPGDILIVWLYIPSALI